MTKHYLSQVEKLKRMILHLAALVDEKLRAAIRSLSERNQDLALRVIETDREIDKYEVEVEEEVLKTLALYQPVATDLRFIIATLKINNDLERIGDLAVNIAKRARDIAQSGVRADVPFDLDALLQTTTEMVKRAADALIAQDSKIANQVLETDDEIDSMHRDNYTLISEEIQKAPELADYYINWLSASRNLERIADHATNIAEDVIYMVEGDIVRHQGP